LSTPPPAALGSTSWSTGLLEVTLGMAAAGLPAKRDPMLRPALDALPDGSATCDIDTFCPAGSIKGGIGLAT
jgi:hypothetical protein